VGQSAREEFRESVSHFQDQAGQPIPPFPHSIGQSVNQAFSQSVSQRVSQSLGQSVSQSIVTKIRPFSRSHVTDRSLLARLLTPPSAAAFNGVGAGIFAQLYLGRDDAEANLER